MSSLKNFVPSFLDEASTPLCLAEVIVGRLLLSCSLFYCNKSLFFITKNKNVWYAVIGPLLLGPRLYDALS